MPNAFFNIPNSESSLSQTWKYVCRIFDSGIIKSAFGAKPIWAQLKITERCNLNCAYCTEHNNNGKHVPLATVTGWIIKCRELGVQHVDFIGGEPLMHPDFVEILDYARCMGMNTGLTTNGFLLNKEYLQKLVDNRISRFQLSIDTIVPNNVTRKALTLLLAQIELIREMNIWVHVNTVLTEETVVHAYELAETLFSYGIPVAFSPAHENGQLILSESYSGKIVDFLDWVLSRKKQGAPVNMPQFLINYYKDLLQSRSVEWKCEGGCKAFYIDTDGGFRPCSHQSPVDNFENVHNGTLKKFHRNKKGCERNCGVSCMILSSFPYNRLDYVLQAFRISPKNKIEVLQEKTCVA
jgi:MoaA/NifB/PqqE/SkfB family radical SAM enzyme